jgi:hypothetical protein
MSTDLPAFEIQQAIYTRLHSDSNLMNLISDVYDEVPELTDYPYVVIAPLVFEPLSGPHAIRYEVQVPLVVYSRAPGNKEGWVICDHLMRLLHQHILAVSGYESLPCIVQKGEMVLLEKEQVRKAQLSLTCEIRAV